MSNPTFLPLEILSEILEYLAEDGGTLARCQLVSKKFNELATPILYRSIRTAWFPYADRNSPIPKGKSQMFKRITLQPELARHAHSFQEVFLFGQAYPSTFRDDALRIVSRHMRSLRQASVSGNAFLGLHVLAKVSLCPQLKELTVCDSIPQWSIWPGRPTNLKILRWKVSRSDMDAFQTDHLAATIPMLNFLFNALEATCPQLESIDVRLPSGPFTNSEDKIYDDPVTQDHKRLFPVTVSEADGENWALIYPRVAYQDHARPSVLRYLNHIGIDENRGVQHVPAFQALLCAFVQNHGATLTSIAIPIGPQRTREYISFIILICKRVPNLKKLTLFQGRDSRGPKVPSKVIDGEAFISTLLDDLTCLHRQIESFTLFDIASSFTPQIGKLFGQLKWLKHLHLGDRNNSILQIEATEENFLIELEHVKIESYDLMSFIKELPTSIETLVLTITGSRVCFLQKNIFDFVSNLGVPIFQKLCRLRSCDIVMWFPRNDTRDFSYRTPQGATHFRRRPLKNSPTHRTLWISQVFDGTSFHFLSQPAIVHLMKMLWPNGKDFAGEDAQNIWLGGPSGITTQTEETILSTGVPYWTALRREDMSQLPHYHKDHVN